MINLVRGNGLPEEVSNLRIFKSNSGYQLTWEHSSTPDLDSIRIFYNGNLLQTSAGFITQTVVNANKTGTFKIVTVDESGRTSSGKEIKY